LRAALSPALAWVITVKRGSAAANSAAMAALPSVLPSSTRITSRSVYVWPRIESRQSRRNASTL
jgi:hypothetical protein